MPVILERGNVDAWLLEPRTDLFAPAGDDVLQEWPVTPRVNSSRYQECDAVLPIPQQQMQVQSSV